VPDCGTIIIRFGAVLLISTSIDFHSSGRAFNAAVADSESAWPLERQTSYITSFDSISLSNSFRPISDNCAFVVKIHKKS
jgi:hypothetical protein